MSDKPIYKITSKKITELLEKEVKRKSNFKRNVLRKVKKIIPETETMSIYESSWDNSLRPGAIVFKKEHEENIDNKFWKKCQDTYDGRGNRRKTYWPKLNTNKGRALAEELRAVTKPERFFQSDEILVAVNYKPKNHIEEVSHNKVTVNTFSVGWTFKDDKYTFYFRGHKGYKPPRGIKEILLSEYNKAFGNE